MLIKHNTNSSVFFKVASLNRFSPYVIAEFFKLTFLTGIILTGVAAISLYFNANEASLLSKILVITALILLLLQLFTTIFFSINKLAYKHQKSQIIVMSFISFKASIDIYLPYFILCDVMNMPLININIGFISLAAGIVLMLLLTLRDVKRVGEGYSFNKQHLLLYQNKKIIRVMIVAIYLIMIIIARQLSKTMGIFEEGYSLVLLYHAVIIQLLVALRWSKLAIAAYYTYKSDELAHDPDKSNLLSKEQPHELKEPKWLNKLIIKFVQYLSLFILALTTTNLSLESFNVVGFIAFLIGVYSLLKWISKYHVTYAGIYFINGLLSGMSFIILLETIVYVTGMGVVDTPIALVYIAICILPIVFWWNFNVLEFLRRYC